MSIRLLPGEDGVPLLTLRTRPTAGAGCSCETGNSARRSEALKEGSRKRCSWSRWCCSPTLAPRLRERKSRTESRRKAEVIPATKPRVFEDCRSLGERGAGDAAKESTEMDFLRGELVEA